MACALLQMLGGTGKAWHPIDAMDAPVAGIGGAFSDGQNGNAHFELPDLIGVCWLEWKRAVTHLRSAVTSMHVLLPPDAALHCKDSKEFVGPHTTSLDNVYVCFFSCVMVGGQNVEG